MTAERCIRCGHPPASHRLCDRRARATCVRYVSPREGEEPARSSRSRGHLDELRRAERDAYIVALCSTRLGPLSVAEVADAMGLPRRFVGSIMRQLERFGWLERVQRARGCVRRFRATAAGGREHGVTGPRGAPLAEE